MATNVPVTLDTLIVIKVLFQGHNKKFKVPLRDLGANVLPDKLRGLLQLQADDEVIFERYSDSAGAYVTLDADKPQVYKTLFRAAKAKLKLRLKATVVGEEEEAPSVPAHIPVHMLQPISSHHASSLHRMSTDTLAPRAPEPVSPVIARSPILPPPFSTYKKPEVEAVQDSPVSPVMTQNVDEGEAPVPRSFTARQSFFNGLAPPPQGCPALALRPKAVPQTSWVVFCNSCNTSMEDEHFHCSICDHGDYDLCSRCVEDGVHCPGSGHWMVKRFVQNGRVLNSTTELVAPKPRPQSEQEMPGSFTDEKQHVEPDEPTRTCNCCVNVLPEKEFVTCNACDDYDLCMECHISNKHGHHPGHGFKAASPGTHLPALADFLCNAGRNVRHSAVCDGCEKFIYGVRHKCLNCPDWDFCSECIKNAKFIHPRHRFVPIYEPLAEPASCAARHYGIYCDGPLCKDKENQSYIEGVRYKCAVCHDTDFCANCEAIPTNRHNRTHPLIKFKTPVRSVSVTTMGEDKNGQAMARLGDQPARRSTATETTPVAPATNAATQVQTVVDMKPIEESQPNTTKEKIEIRDLLTEPVPEKISVQDLLSTPAPSAPTDKLPQALDAHFVRDTMPDGTKIGAGLNFVQVWTLRNPGPNAWPAGCSVRHVGGDNMLNLDNSRPLSQSELSEASESNVVGRSVEVGEEISFRIILKAPNREGTAISYWRLKTADGTPFGHRLWCDIQVVGPTTPIAIPIPQPAAAQLKSETVESRPFTPSMTPIDRLQALQARLNAFNVQKNKEASQFAGQEKDTQLNDSLDKILRIQQVRKAAVERLMENRRKEHEAFVVNLQPAAKAPEVPKVPVEQETAELPVEEKAVEPQPESSGMIFPQLDKESPASSTHEAVSAKSAFEDVKSETATIAAPSVQSDEEFFEDAESVEIRSISSDDEGFLTDEEYDILDASDEEA